MTNREIAEKLADDWYRENAIALSAPTQAALDAAERRAKIEVLAEFSAAYERGELIGDRMLAELARLRAEEGK